MARNGENVQGNKTQDYSENAYPIFDPTAGADRNIYKNCNLDMPFGFQDINPMIFTVIGEIIGNVLSGKLPVNVANSFGNWIQLVAQAMLVFNAQQQYSQGGPGRYYSPDYKNVTNPFTVAQDTEEETNKRDKGKKSDKKRNRKNYNEVNETIRRLNDKIAALEEEINRLKNKM